MDIIVIYNILYVSKDAPRDFINQHWHDVCLIRSYYTILSSGHTLSKLFACLTQTNVTNVYFFAMQSPSTKKSLDTKDMKLGIYNIQFDIVFILIYILLT